MIYILQKILWVMWAKRVIIWLRQKKAWEEWARNYRGCL